MANNPFLCLVWALGDAPPGILPHPDQGLPGGQGGHPSQPIYHPGHPDHGLPPYPSHPIAPGGGQGGRPSQPIYHPGHPDHGLPPFPDQGLPGKPGGRPDQGLPPFPSQGLPEGGVDVPSNELPLPEPPEEYADDTIVAVKKPGEEWVVKAYEDVGISNPQPTPHQ